MKFFNNFKKLKMSRGKTLHVWAKNQRRKMKRNSLCENYSGTKHAISYFQKFSDFPNFDDSPSGNGNFLLHLYFKFITNDDNILKNQNLFQLFDIDF